MQSERPDLLQQFPSYPDRVIPSNPPVGFFKGITFAPFSMFLKLNITLGIAVPSIGELMLASFYSNSIFNHSSWYWNCRY